MSDFNDLFNDKALDSKMSFLDESKSTGADGLYRIDLKKVSDKKKGYRATLRFLPNFTQEKTVGASAIEKVTHYVKLPDNTSLSGFYDSPKNINPETNSAFSDKCPLTDLYWTMKNSKNAILVEKANSLNYSKKFFSYVLVVEDEQQPELVGKILIFQYGKTIKDKISIERNGEISGEPCNIFKLNDGKDFQLIVKEVQDEKGNTFPDYKMCQFKPSTTSISLLKGGEMTNAPLDDNGQIPTGLQSKIVEFLLDRTVNIEDFAPKALTSEQLNKIDQITGVLTGKVSNVPNNSVGVDDFTMDSNTEAVSKQEDVDDFDFDF